MAALSGLAAQAVGLGAVLAAAHGSPDFSWMEDNISILGIEGCWTAVFNGGLVADGALSLAFAFALGRGRTGRSARRGAGSLALGALGLLVMGAFPVSTDLPHDLATLVFFVFTALGLVLIGLEMDASWRRLTLAAGAVMLVLQLGPWPWKGAAIPQLLACVPWSAWTVALGIALLFGADPFRPRVVT